MERIVLRHLSGSKANQVDEFPLSQIQELTFGRDPSSVVKYDPDRDDLVGRQHAKISQDPADPTQFTISDLSSRNGTYVNKQRIVGSAKILPGDLVQFGPGGPEFQFDLEPRPANLVRPTRIGDTPGVMGMAGGPPPTRAGTAPPMMASTAPGMSADTRVGRATVELMVAQSKSDSKKVVLLAAIALFFLVIIGGAGIFIYEKFEHNQTILENEQKLSGIKGSISDLSSKTAAMTPADIASNYTEATVLIQVNWSLLDPNGSPLYFLYKQNTYHNAYDPFGVYRQIVPGRDFVACYTVLSTDQGTVVEPTLTTDTRLSLPVGYPIRGSGFCVTNDGFIATNLHVAAPWNVNYKYSPNMERFAFPGLLLDSQGNAIFNQDGTPKLIASASQLGLNGSGTWIPAGTKQFGTLSQLGRPALQGRDDTMDVTFANTDLRRPAKMVAPSIHHDVALIKIDVPEAIKKVDLNDNYDTIKPGESVTVLGYPGGSPQLIGVVGTRGAGGLYEPFQAGIIPNPTLSVGNIAQILRPQDATGGKEAIYSSSGDIYQLTINSTGGGNSGGPVFDDHGRVVAVYTYGFSTDFQASGAVPIKYAMELMGNKKVN